MTIDDGFCSNYHIYHVNNDETYEIIWNGGSIPSYCSYGFIGRDSGYMNEYKVCIDVTNFAINDCDVTAKYDMGINSVVAEVSTG